MLREGRFLLMVLDLGSQNREFTSHSILDLEPFYDMGRFFPVCKEVGLQGVGNGPWHSQVD